MKFWNYLLCVINTMLVILITIKLIEAEKFYTLLILILLVPMVIFNWYVTISRYKKEIKQTKE